MLSLPCHKHQWFSGRIRRCHRRDPGSIPGWCNFCQLQQLTDRATSTPSTSIGNLTKTFNQCPCSLMDKALDF